MTATMRMVPQDSLDIKRWPSGSKLVQESLVIGHPGIPLHPNWEKMVNLVKVEMKIRFLGWTSHQPITPAKLPQSFYLHPNDWTPCPHSQGEIHQWGPEADWLFSDQNGLLFVPKWKTHWSPWVSLRKTEIHRILSPSACSQQCSGHLARTPGDLGTPHVLSSLKHGWNRDVSNEFQHSEHDFHWFPGCLFGDKTYHATQPQVVKV